MTRRQRGFILVEALLYSSLILFFSALSMSYAADCYVRLCSMLKTQTGSAQLHTTLDVLARDLLRAPARKTGWKLISDTAHVWTTSTGDVGMAQTARGIIRTHGLFDKQRQRWIKRTKSFFAPQLSYSLQPLHENKDSFLLLRLTIHRSERQKAEIALALRSGVFV